MIVVMMVEAVEAAYSRQPPGYPPGRAGVAISLGGKGGRRRRRQRRRRAGKPVLRRTYSFMTSVSTRRFGELCAGKLPLDHGVQKGLIILAGFAAPSLSRATSGLNLGGALRECDGADRMVVLGVCPCQADQTILNQSEEGSLDKL